MWAVNIFFMKKYNVNFSTDEISNIATKYRQQISWVDKGSWLITEIW